MTYQHPNSLDKLNRSVNSFATQSFRDQADRDYITARLACRADLIPQFLWAAQQAIEKYLKAILLYNRIKANTVGHDLLAALSLTQTLPFTIDLSPRSRSFIDHLSQYGEFRYIDVPYFVNGHILIELDLTVWELRRYCQVLDVFGKRLPSIEQELLTQANDNLKKSMTEPRYKFCLHGGLLEKILETPKHPSRSGLIWQNASFGTRARAIVRAKKYVHFQNPQLYLYPEMLDEILKFVFIPKKIADGYREHLAKVKANPLERP